MIEYKSISGRSFLLKEGTSIPIHNKANKKNINDIAFCATLAFHKSIIGICELAFLESAKSPMGKIYRSSIAVQTYYIVYHLFCGCMLLDPDYDIKISSKPPRKNTESKLIHYEVELAKLNCSDEYAYTWNNCKDNEMDMATSITHGVIKKYCEKLRKDKSEPDYLRILFDSFISEKCDQGNNPMLFERLDYIRDRSIYRPSVVVEAENPYKYAQTSNDVKKEIDSLPSSEKLYDIIKRIISALTKVDGNDIIEQFQFAFNNYCISCDDKHLSDVGYTWDVVEKMGGNREFESVPSFVYQLMELFEPQAAITLYQKYWDPIFSAI